LITLTLAARSAAAKALLDHEVGEAYANVQGESLKAYAAFPVSAYQLPDHQGREHVSDIYPTEQSSSRLRQSEANVLDGEFSASLASAPGNPDSDPTAKCTFCLEPLNQGASVCKSCGRSQPKPAHVSEKQRNIIAAVGIGLLLLAAIAVPEILEAQKNAVISRIVNCSRMHGDASLTESAVRFQLNNERQPGVSWDQAARFMLNSRGCPAD
jgi:hypothetical protein